MPTNILQKIYDLLYRVLDRISGHYITHPEFEIIDKNAVIDTNCKAIALKNKSNIDVLINGVYTIEANGGVLSIHDSVFFSKMTESLRIEFVGQTPGLPSALPGGEDPVFRVEMVRMYRRKTNRHIYNTYEE